MGSHFDESAGVGRCRAANSASEVWAEEGISTTIAIVRNREGRDDRHHDSDKMGHMYTWEFEGDVLMLVNVSISGVSNSGYTCSFLYNCCHRPSRDNTFPYCEKGRLIN